MAAQPGSSGEPSTQGLWDGLMQEVERLTSTRKRGVNFSEDFAVDRVCAALRQLRRQPVEGSAPAADTDAAAPGAAAGRGNVEELVGLRVELAMEEQRLRIQQAKIDEARMQIKQAKEAREQLERELESEAASRKQASDAQAKLWREQAVKTHQCLASLRAKEQEAAQLKAALARPGNLSDTWEGLVKKLQVELDEANAEALEAKRELDRVSAECLRAQHDLAGRGGEALAGPAPGPQGAEDKASTHNGLQRMANGVSDSGKTADGILAGLGPKAPSPQAGAGTILGLGPASLDFLGVQQAGMKPVSGYPSIGGQAPQAPPVGAVLGY